MQLEELSLENKIKVVKGMLKTYFDGNLILKPISYSDFYDTNNKNNYVYRFYVSTNENLHYFEQLTSFNNKDVLVPTASGDHALNAIFFGANSVETFDINSIAKYHSDLKTCAIQHLTRAEFLKFYSFHDLLDKNIYDKFKNHLEDETKFFFDEIFKFVDDYNEHKQYLNTLHPIVEERTYDMAFDMIYNNPYLENDDTYKMLQHKLAKLKNPIKHTLCPADEITDNFDKKDIIIMSNIYSAYMQTKIRNNENIKPYITEIPNLLKENGTASLNYFYAGTPSDIRERYMINMDKLPLNYRIVNVKPKWSRIHQYDVIYAVDNANQKDNAIEK